MILLHFLRMMGDLSFYYAFAGFFLALTGNAMILPCIVLPSLCYAFSCMIEKGTVFKISALLPCLILFVLPGMSPWDRIALIPVFVYLVVLVFADRSTLSHDRQEDVFRLFLKAYPVFFVLMCAFSGFQTLIKSSLPSAVLMVILSIFLMRTLRHNKETYLSKPFMLRNCLTAGVFIGGAWILHLKSVTSAFQVILLTIYNKLIVPLLTAVLYVISHIIGWIVNPLLSLFSGSESVELDLDFSVFDEADQAAAESSAALKLPVQALKTAGIVVGILLLILLLICLFYRLAGSRTGEEASEYATEVIHHLPSAAKNASDSVHTLSPLDPVNQVRRQYRRYLKKLDQRGMPIPVCYTSADISRVSSRVFQDSDDAEKLRDLYIQARYHGTASREDVKKAKALVQKLKDE